MIVRAIIKHVTKWLNNFPVKNGVSEKLILRKIIRGKDVKFNRDCQLEIWSYVQVHKYPDPINRPEDHRSVRAMSLGPSENEQGCYYFMILETGKGFIGSNGPCYLLLKQ